jgi:adenine deaminase
MAEGELHANLVDVAARRIFVARLRWRDGHITEREELGAEDAALRYVIPGFVDAHVHIESSMLPPAELGRIAVRHGTVATVSDPHEIANVLGASGVRFMLESARSTPVKIALGAPSCVPATPFETAGASLGPAEVAELLDEEGVCFLSEVMNWPGVLDRAPDVMAKIEAARSRGYPVDGHAPGLLGDDARRYAEAGITTDHECTSLEEGRAKLAAGMKVLIREGSAARDFEALHPLISEAPDDVMLCSDDKHPDDLVGGHIREVAVRALAAGHHVMDVLRAACTNPVRHYGLDVGQLRVGDAMDAVVVRDLRALEVERVFIDGALVAEGGRSLLPHEMCATPNVFRARAVDAAELSPAHPAARALVMDARDGLLTTGRSEVAAPVEDGRLVPDATRDLALLANLGRYAAAPPAVALVRGFGLRRGALASSVAHDSHNVVGVGASAHELARAMNAVVAAKGGVAVVDGERTELLALPIAGLMSPEDGDVVARRYAELDALAHDLGSELRAPFMTLSFMALLVIPSLKLSDRGLFDGERFEPVPLGVD